MGAIVFDNHIFDSWLNKKSDEILSKVDREKISTEEMIILVLKAQTNHFHHMDEEFRTEFTSIRKEVAGFRGEVDKRFDRITKILMWGGALMVSLFSGLYLKLVF